jgi:RNA polymerase sigma factor (TIGR02999 family)
MAGGASFTRLLESWQGGDLAAREVLVPIVVEGLHRTAERLMGHERAGHTLQPTALVNETYLRLEHRLSEANFPSRAHFFGLVIDIMRKLLVDYARRKKAEKRGGGLERVPLESVGAFMGPMSPPDLLLLDELFEQLSQLDRLASDVFARRHILGFDVETIAEDLGVSQRTVERKLRLARAWLTDKLTSVPRKTSMPERTSMPQEDRHA